MTNPRTSWGKNMLRSGILIASSHTETSKNWIVFMDAFLRHFQLFNAIVVYSGNADVANPKVWDITKLATDFNKISLQFKEELIYSLSR